MTMMEILMVIFFFFPLGALVAAFFVWVTWMQVQEECSNEAVDPNRV